jgi:hypothetical protein
MRISLDRRRLCIAQGVYYGATGVWPLLDRRSFEAVTGPKTDFWLVRTVGALVAVAGAVMVMAGVRDRISPEVRLLAEGTAASFTAVNTVYVRQGRISKIYLLDAAAEVVLLAAWALLPDRVPHIEETEGRLSAAAASAVTG